MLPDWIPPRFGNGKSEAQEVIEMPAKSHGVKSQKFERTDYEIGPDKETDYQRHEPCLNVRLLKVIQPIHCEECRLFHCVGKGESVIPEARDLDFAI